MSSEFDLSSVSEVFHGSPERGLSLLAPRVSTHGESWIYATPFIEVACSYLSKWDDLDFAQIHWYGEFHLVERYPGAFEQIFPKGQGSIYCLPPEKFSSFNYMEAVCKEAVVPLKEIVIENSWDYIREIARSKKLFLHYYPNRPAFVPSDDSDLLVKVAKWLQRHEAEWQESSLFKRFQSKHAKLEPRLLSQMGF